MAKKIIISEKEAQMMTDAFIDSVQRKIQGMVAFYNSSYFKKYKVRDEEGNEVKQFMTVEDIKLSLH